MILATLRDFARMLRVPATDADEALRSERAARTVLSRRNLFAAAGAMAAGSVFSFAPSPPVLGWVYLNGAPWVPILDWEGVVLSEPVNHGLTVAFTPSKRGDYQTTIGGQVAWISTREGKELYTLDYDYT